MVGRRFPEVSLETRAFDYTRGIPSGPFDGVLAWHSFFHLAHDPQRAMFPIFAAHAAPGAALMFTSGWEEGESIGEWRGEPLYHASLDTAEYRALLEANGFEILHHVVQDPDCGHATIWLARKL